MAFGRSPRMDNRRPSSQCSTATLVVFVALCLVGVWMMTSSTVVPVDMSSSGSKQRVSQTDSKQFEDSSGDIPDGAMKKDANIDEDKSPNEPDSEPTQDQNVPEKTTEKRTQESTEDDSDNASNGRTYNDENGKGEGGEIAKKGEDTNSEGGDMNTAGQEDGQDKSKEQNSAENTANEQEDNKDRNPDETANDDQNKNPEQNSVESNDNEQQQDDNNTDSNIDETASDKQTNNFEQNADETKSNEQQQSDRDKINVQEEEPDGDKVQDGKDQGQLEQKVGQNQDKDAKQNSRDIKSGNQTKDQPPGEVFPDATQSELLNETNTQNGAWSTQAVESRNEKEVQAASSKGQNVAYSWKLCNVTAAFDYIPCLDNEEAIKKLRSTKHFQHRERHCPDEAPTCLVPLPEGYKQQIAWPNSRDKIWYHNVPHTTLADFKGHQNWVKVTGEYLTFPGGGTQFKNGAIRYIDFIKESVPDVAWGKKSRVVLDVGCGVASFGGYLFERDVLTMSFAPKDEHEAQVQFALERGIPAISAVMGTKRLPFPSRVFDVVHCARCRVPWHTEGGMLLLEINRLLRPGGYFVWSATPVYQKIQDDVEIWNAMSWLTKSMCWEMVNKTGRDIVNQVGLAVYRKPTNNECYEKRTENNPPFCQESDDPDAAWNVPLQACMHKLPVSPAVRGSQWPEEWPQRLEKAPYWLNSSEVGVYGKPAPEDFAVDYEHWRRVVSKSYLNGMGINWTTVRNVMDMRSVYGGFAAALRDKKVWVMNVVSIDSPDTLPVIYERGFFGMYHDWCESFSTYPRTYDLLHADHLFSRLKKRCKLLPVIVEVDRILRPEGKLLVRDNAEIINEVESIAKSLHWEIRMTYSKNNEGLLCVQKTMWRPKEVASSTTPIS
ncbi:probable methyltransferase PMT26 [Phoenix dactylifera]|uniref:Probable methyltransferase PMT26 n=1 Tax=Phoenix dactylifera TaxID=42345 RepID=A0A8B7BMJ8_PHODC|nr:probable methyltransferase PMT26 [Phoenix dactylifera]XP_038989435.1 probable methyltransferase PMT26 [Phoenix dactylifera]